MAHIVIVVHRDASFTEAEYFMRPLSEVWQEQGHTVTVVSGTDTFVDGDIGVLHVDLTVIPDDYLELMRRYPKTINGAVKDISKRRISGHIVTPGDGYEGQVIVKTDLNCGGSVEASLSGRRSFAARCWNAVRRRLPLSFRSEIRSTEYPIFDSPKKVPPAVWRNKSLIVERFQPERRGDLYCLRSWVFVGDREVSSLYTAHQPVIKGGNFIERILVDLPDEIREIRRELNFDFGKFDYVMVDGRVVLYDVARTPTLGITPRDQYMPRIRLLAEGLDSLLKS